MKKLIVALTLMTAVACSEQKTEQVENEATATTEEVATEEKNDHKHHEHSSESEEWKEMDDYHMLMAETFHPAEEKDFEPIRSKAEEMAQSAETWKNSTAPKAFDKPEIKEKLDLLATESRDLAAFVKTEPTDEALFEKLNALHDRFHEVMGECHHQH